MSVSVDNVTIYPGNILPSIPTFRIYNYDTYNKWRNNEAGYDYSVVFVDWYSFTLPSTIDPKTMYIVGAHNCTITINKSISGPVRIINCKLTITSSGHINSSYSNILYGCYIDWTPAHDGYLGFNLSLINNKFTIYGSSTSFKLLDGNSSDFFTSEIKFIHNNSFYTSDSYNRALYDCNTSAYGKVISISTKDNKCPYLTVVGDGIYRIIFHHARAPIMYAGYNSTSKLLDISMSDNFEGVETGKNKYFKVPWTCKSKILVLWSSNDAEYQQTTLDTEYIYEFCMSSNPKSYKLQILHTDDSYLTLKSTGTSSSSWTFEGASNVWFRGVYITTNDNI